MHIGENNQGFFTFPRLALILIQISFLSFLFCSKGPNSIDPVIPPRGYEPEISSPDIAYLEPNRSTQEEEQTGYHQQISPILSTKAIDRIDKKLSLIIGEGQVPSDQIIFVDASPVGISETNPPLIQFSFSAPENTISPDDISITVDDCNISKEIIYNVSFNPKRNADFWVAHHQISYYLNPLAIHQIKINIKPEYGNSINKTFNFTVKNDKSLRILDAGFQKDEMHKDRYQMDSLIVAVKTPEFIFNGDSIIKPQKWQIRYENYASLPDISDIEKVAPHIVKIRFASDFEPDKKISISFSPDSGISSNQHQVITPKIPFGRGGGVYRKIASDYDECSTCQEDGNGNDYGLTSNPEDIHEAQFCQDVHRWTVHAFCPPADLCSPGKTECLRVTSYSYNNRYLIDNSETGIAVSPINYCPDTIGTCIGFTRTYDSDFDVMANYEMLALPKPPPGEPPPEEYCSVDELDPPIFVISDRQIPIIDSVTFPEEDTSPPNCTDVCCKSKKYFILVEAHDDHCMNSYNTILIVFYKDASHRFLHPDVVEGEIFDNGRGMIQKFQLDTPNVFACATELKVIVHDKKGNWNSHHVYPQTGNQRELDKLPYPKSLILSLGDRNFENGDRQYVNLENYYEKDTSDICCWKPININNGPYIYIEINTLPPIYKVDVQVEWLDPQSTGLITSMPPTNRKGDHYGIASNRDLTDEQHEMLWSNHPAWGLDGRSLGDNYNFFGDPNDCGTPNAPDCDPNSPKSYPIRHITDRIIPCFLSPPECNPGVPLNNPNYPEYCLDLNCPTFGFKGLSTNVNGKSAVHFVTRSHGGDNFQFRAYTCFGTMNDCLISNTSETITLWRKMTVDYSWMAKRTSYACGTKRKEHRETHQINNDDWLWFLQGVFDDSYIQIEEGNTITNTHYLSVVNELPSYENNHVHWKDQFFPFVPFDSALSMGLDHIEDPCPIGSFVFGRTHVPPYPESQDWLTSVAVGCIHDFYLKRKEYYADGVILRDWSYACLLSMAHELTHCFIYGGGYMHLADYGLMTKINKSSDLIWRYRRRSYHYHDHIMTLRKELPNFDGNDL